MFRFLKKLAFFSLVLLVFLELLFRFIIPAAQKPAYYVDSESGLVLFDSSFKTKGTYTWGRVPLDGGQWQLNNDGWLSVYDYQPIEQKDKPRVALIGDSFIAGLSTDKETHIDVQLTEAFEGSVDFYSFGMGGQYLEQYRVLLDYLDEKYDPDIYVFFINSRDIKSGLTTYGKYPLYNQLDPDGDGFLHIPPRPYRESKVKRMARISAFMHYIKFNAGLKIFGGGRAIVDANANPDQDAVNSEAEADPILARAADYIFDKMMEGRERKQFLFVGDGRRNRLYEGESDPPLHEDCLLIQAACEARAQCHYLDLMEVFKADYRENGQMFNFEDNYHWNVYGSELVARTLTEYLKDNHFLPPS